MVFVDPYASWMFTSYFSLTRHLKTYSMLDFSFEKICAELCKVWIIQGLQEYSLPQVSSKFKL